MKAIRHTGICVNDLAGAIHFYRDVLGLKIQRDMLETGEFIDKLSGLKDVKVRTVKMSADNGSLIELLWYESHRGGERNRDIFNAGYSHISFTVLDLDFLCRRLRGEGIKFNYAPQVSPDGKAKVVFCRDPEGNLIELVEEISKT